MLEKLHDKVQVVRGKPRHFGLHFRALPRYRTRDRPFCPVGIPVLPSGRQEIPRIPQKRPGLLIIFHDHDRAERLQFRETGTDHLVKGGWLQRQREIIKRAGIPSEL